MLELTHRFTSPAALASLLVLTFACAPKNEALDTTDATETTANHDTTATADSTAAPTSSSTGTGEPTGGGCVEGPVDGELACEPPGASKVEVMPDMTSLESATDLPCTVKSVDDDGTLQKIVLTCADDEIGLGLMSSKPHVAATVTPGQSVLFTYQALDGGEVIEELFHVHDMEGDLILAGISGVLEPDTLPLTLAPLSIDLPSSDCEASLGFEDCWIAQSTALRVTWGDKTVDVFGGHTGNLGSSPDYAIVTGTVDRAICYGEDVACSYNTFGVEALIVALP